AIKFVLAKHLIQFQSVTRKGSLRFSDVDQEMIQNHQIIINSTPLGTFPNVSESPEIPFEFLEEQHLAYDLIYNPEKTKFLALAENQGAKIKNGLEMLVLQAEKSWEI